MEIKATAIIKFDKGEISKGDNVWVNVEPLCFTYKGEKEEAFELDCNVEVSELEDWLGHDDLINTIEIMPKQSDDEDIELIYQMLRSEGENMAYDKFKNKSIFITYDYGQEKIVIQMEASERDLYISGKIIAGNAVFKYHIRNGKVSGGNFECDIDVIDADDVSE